MIRCLPAGQSRDKVPPWPIPTRPPNPQSLRRAVFLRRRFPATLLPLKDAKRRLRKRMLDCQISKRSALRAWAGMKHIQTRRKVELIQFQKEKRPIIGRSPRPLSLKTWIDCITTSASIKTARSASPSPAKVMETLGVMIIRLLSKPRLLRRRTFKKRLEKNGQVFLVLTCIRRKPSCLSLIILPCRMVLSSNMEPHGESPNGDHGMLMCVDTM